MDVRCRFIKLHVSVDVRTKKIYTMTITDDKCMNHSQFADLVAQDFASAEKLPNVSASAGTGVAADGAYNSPPPFSICIYYNKHEICSLTLIHIDFIENTNGCMPRKEAGFRQISGFNHIDKNAKHESTKLSREQTRVRQKIWCKESGYNDRRTAGITFSTLKLVLCEYKSDENGRRQDRNIRKGAAAQPDD